MVDMSCQHADTNGLLLSGKSACRKADRALASSHQAKKTDSRSHGSPASTLNPGFGAERQVHGDGISAIHKPNSGDKLQEAYKAGTRTPGEQACRNLDGVDKAQTD